MTKAVTLGECEPGLFLFGDTLGFKSEYKTRNGRGFHQSDAYCVESGEYFWGGAASDDEREKLLVRPMPGAAANFAPDMNIAVDLSGFTEARPLDEWHEERGDVIWWRVPLCEPPYLGSPVCLGHTVEAHGYHGILARFQVGGWPYDEDDEPFLRWAPVPIPEIVT